MSDIRKMHSDRLPDADFLKGPYNGDHMSMYGVNASVPKTLVRHLVRYFADTCGSKVLSEVLFDILDTPVSPELLPPKEGEISQKTEGLVGPYELHDFFLYYILRFGFVPEKIYRIHAEFFRLIQPNPHIRVTRHPQVPARRYGQA